MKRLLALVILLLLIIIRPDNAFSQGMTGSDGHTAREEAEGKEIWDKLQSKQLECKNLTDDNYAALGEYFMGQSIGNTERHEAMNRMMISMMGEEGEKQMHIVMGKRLSSCDTSAQIPSGGIGFMPMMWMMGSTGTSAMSSGTNGSPQVRGGGNPMMGGWNGFGLFGWFSMILFWALLILGVIALIRYLIKSGQNKEDEQVLSFKNRTPVDILKQRYARGEIDKKEFEEKKKDLL